MAISAERRAYDCAKTRCTNPNHVGYRYYGGRGIEFRFKSFKEFHAELGDKPSPELTLDRINNDGHYEVGNVRWATRAQQANNKRQCKGWSHHKRSRELRERTLVRLEQLRAENERLEKLAYHI